MLYLPTGIIGDFSSLFFLLFTYDFQNFYTNHTTLKMDKLIYLCEYMCVYIIYVDFFPSLQYPDLLF